MGGGLRCVACARRLVPHALEVVTTSRRQLLDLLCRVLPGLDLVHADDQDVRVLGVLGVDGGTEEERFAFGQVQVACGGDAEEDGRNLDAPGVAIGCAQLGHQATIVVSAVVHEAYFGDLERLPPGQLDRDVVHSGVGGQLERVGDEGARRHSACASHAHQGRTGDVRKAMRAHAGGAARTEMRLGWKATTLGGKALGKAMGKAIGKQSLLSSSTHVRWVRGRRCLAYATEVPALFGLSRGRLSRDSR